MAMRFLATAGVLLSPLLAAAAPSAKRGLIFIPNSTTLQDNSIWVQTGSDLTWYYNYGNLPSSDYASIPQSRFEFVPMMWGVGPNPSQDFAFHDSVINLINSGTNITHVMSFNEPDAPSSWGGSDVTPHNAALAWIANFIPLQQRGIKIGAPATTGAPSGLDWLHQFFGNCTQLIGRDCPYDFVSLHWYDNFDGLKAHISDYTAAFPGKKLWVTEYAYANQPLAATQQFFNTSASYMDGLSNLERYSYFGAFRSNVSNVGPNATFLNNAGRLTDIGSLYLGGGLTGVLPTSNS
ncbi:glycoside hydrolase family 128 protein [Trichoderma camerunense]|uniref:Glycosyl hydrolase catalytic core domain-containing protein n=3 Tax=Trichoderma TaxID=5543 RepID=A0A9W9JT14_9HYPO|nr:glycosyl hydrolase catalytic core domain-containing protein [Trichoderma breve]KAF3068516.1 Alkali-sensitive linkage protein 1 [Trichoderma lentiforme]KAJ4865127.1 glycosyl hydrolase catalytic core domain-containing protein [Trichoderma breve]OPB38565.1 hypothetical protein A0O28_0016710 [Trichoderma guizhouense]